MVSLLSNLVDNLTEGILKIKCEYGHGIKEWEISGIKYNDCEFSRVYTNVKDDLTKYKWLRCICTSFQQKNKSKKKTKIFSLFMIYISKINKKQKKYAKSSYYVKNTVK